MLALFGLIALRLGERAIAQEAFTGAVEKADALLTYSTQNYFALDAKALALCGLAVCENRPDRVAAAVEAYRAARAINKEVGIVGRVLRLFDALTPADMDGLLTGVRAVAGGR